MERENEREGKKMNEEEETQTYKGFIAQGYPK